MNRSFQTGLPVLAGVLLYIAAASAASAAVDESPAPPGSAQVAAPNAAAETLLYSVTLNGQPLGDVVLLRSRDGRLLVRAEDWRAWNLAAPRGGSFEFEGEKYWSLNDINGFTVELNAARQEASLHVPAQAFAESRFDAASGPRALAQVPDHIGGFVNYEAVASDTHQDATGGFSDLGADAEAGIFTPLGVGTSQWVGRGLNRSEASPGTREPTRDIIRLDSAWRYDDPVAMTTLRLGDGAGKAGLWGRAVRFGGLQWARNFSTQPGFITVPLPTLRGENALPSVLDVYVDGVRRQTLDAPPGPFVIENIPAVNGLGQIDLVVRDMLGREQLISVPYLAGARQLRAGLHDYSYEAGWVRENFGIISDDYGPFVATALHRYGFTDEFTGEARLEARSGGGQTAGLGAIVGVPESGIFSLAGAYSHEASGDGALALVSWERTVRRGVSLGARVQWTTPEFVQSGLGAGFPPPARLVAANIGTGLAHNITVGVGYISQQNRSALPDTDALTGRIAVRVGAGSLALLLFERLQPDPDHIASLSYTLPLGGQAYGSAGYRHHEDRDGLASDEYTARVQRNIPYGEGWGYRAQVTQYESETESSGAAFEGGAELNATHGSYGLEAYARDDVRSVRGTLAGALGEFHDHWFATRRINDGFGLVESGVAGLPLRLNSQPAGDTNAEGIAILPNLQEYQANEVQVDVDNVAIDVDVPAPVVNATPYYRSGIVVPLPARQTRSALVTFQMGDGSPMPAGATVTLKSTGDVFPVARLGQAYVSGLAAGSNPIEVRLRELTCELTLTLTANAEAQTRLGPYTCPEMSQ